MYLLNYIMFIIVMAMSCDMVRYITCMFYPLCKITVTIKSNKFIYFSYIVCIISVNVSMLIKTNTMNIIITGFLYLHYAIIYLIVVKNISWILVNMLIYVICVIEYSVIRSFI